jgi:putative spermidine/putrescine transport system ATP-binding protein
MNKVPNVISQDGSQEMSNTKSILELVGVRKVYGSAVAVEGVDLTLRNGEFLTFLGPSGSGKTTTLAMIAGLQMPTAGKILLNGQAVDPLPPYKRNIGMVFQNYALFPHMTVAGNIGFPLEMRGMDAAERKRRIAKTLELIGLPSMGDRYPHQLSGGQQQRVALGRAIVFEPPLLLMDEPLGALDKKLRVQMQLEITRLHRELGISILYVTHDQEEALVMSDRIAVFNEGKIEQLGTAKDLYERPTTAFVAGFLGESNFFHGTVSGLSEGRCFMETPYGQLGAFNNASLQLGDKATLAVRPERLFLYRGRDKKQENCISGTLTDLIYLGQSRKCVLRTTNGDEVVALQHAQQVAETSMNIGEEVCVTWNCADANALNHSTASN